MEQYLIEILTAIIAIAIGYLVPQVKYILRSLCAKILKDFDEKRRQAIEDYVSKVVATVYQKYFTLPNADKFAKALYLVEERFGKTIFTEEQLTVLIESAYLDLKKELNINTIPDINTTTTTTVAPTTTSTTIIPTATTIK